MNTTELVDAVAEANDLSKAKAKEFVNSFLLRSLTPQNVAKKSPSSDSAASPSRNVQLAKGATREPVTR